MAKWMYVQPHIVGNPESGYSEAYSSDLRLLNTRRLAWRHGLRTVGSDDFLVAKHDGERVVELYWGDTEPARDDADEVAAVNREFGWLA